MSWLGIYRCHVAIPGMVFTNVNLQLQSLVVLWKYSFKVSQGMLLMVRKYFRNQFKRRFGSDEI